jgi:hypothetical protein
MHAHRPRTAPAASALRYAVLALGCAVLLGCAPRGLLVEYAREVDYEPSARSEPPALTERGDAVLKAGGYVRLGLVRVTRDDRHCYPGEPCKDIEVKQSLEDAAAAEGASRGGDLIRREAPPTPMTRPVNKLGRCLRNEFVRQEYTDKQGRKRVNQVWVCAEHEYVFGVAHGIRTEFSLWRLRDLSR